MSLKSCRILLTLFLCLTICGCPATKHEKRWDREQAQDTLKQLETAGMVVGEFQLADHAFIDGDTVKIVGLDSTLRLLAIDTEENVHKPEEQEDLDRDWETWDDYLAFKKGNAKKPIKCATPLGDEAKVFAEEFFKDSPTALLERDHPKEVRGRFGRYLVYIYAKRDGEWVNYNIESVRAGMSPYFTKYSYSRRFHEEFVQAQKEAQEARRGIWDPNKKHYNDYAERLTWWNARADFIREFEIEAEQHDNYVALTNWDSLQILEAHLDQEVVVLGGVSQIKLGDKGPTKVLLGRRQFSDFPLIFYDKDVFLASNISRYKGEYVRVTGKVTKYYNKYKEVDELQIVINLPGQIVGSDNLPGFSDPQTEEVD